MVTYLAAYWGYSWFSKKEKSDEVTELEDTTDVNVHLLSTSDEIINCLRRIDKRLLLVLIILLTVMLLLLILTRCVITLKRKTGRDEICENCDYNC